jgi:pilus assembly protein TadC
MVWGVVAAITLVVAVPILLFNQQHSGDRLKIRRELRKF